MSNETKVQPVAKFQAGAIGISVWRRDHNGQTFYTTNAQRAYTKDDGKTWEHTDSFNRDDLPVVAALLNRAFEWIISQTK